MEVRIRYKNYKKKMEPESDNPRAPEDGHTDRGSQTPDIDKDKLWMRTYNWSEEQLNELKEVFSMFDTNGQGLIAAHSLGTALRAIGQTPTEAEMQELLQDASLDDEGHLDVDEYMRLIGQRGLKSEGEMEEELEDAMRVFDKQGEGCVDAEELKGILRTLGEPVDDDDIAELLKVAEVAGDGKINYYDFIKKMTAK